MASDGDVIITRGASTTTPRGGKEVDRIDLTHAGFQGITDFAVPFVKPVIGDPTAYNLTSWNDTAQFRGDFSSRNRPSCRCDH